jgi:Putative esterase
MALPGWRPARRFSVACLIALLVCVPAVASAQARESTLVAANPPLPSPFSGWDVTVTPTAGDDHVLTLAFNSPLLRQRVTNTVWLPDSYTGSGAPFPVMYVLHGTVMSPLDNCALNPVTGQETLVQMISCGGGYLQDGLYDIPGQLAAMQFVAVAPDTNPDYSFCDTCMWVNGRDDLIPNVYPLTANELPADAFLHQELYPLVQALFDVRTDRGGRGVMGFSMGGWAAALQGMLHPDDYSYIGYVSGGYDIEEPVLLTSIIEPVGYFRDQGYGATPQLDPAWWAQYNPIDISSNLKGVTMKFFLSSGDGCTAPADLEAPECQGEFSPVKSPSGSVLETELGYNRTLAVADLTAKGIPFTTVETPGTHGANNAEMYAGYIVPEANAQFAAGAPAPATFGYRSVMPDFSVWGYDVSVRRSAAQFLDMTGARTDGRAFTLTGSGTVTVTTPAAFTPGQSYTVTQSPGQSATTIADADGRLTIAVSLGTNNTIYTEVTNS